MKKSNYLFLLVLIFVFLGLVYFIRTKEDKSSVILPEPQVETVFEDEVIDTSADEYGLPRIPVYPGAAFVETSESFQGEDFQYMSNWETEDLVPQVMDWYVKRLSDGEWEIEKFPYDPGMEGKQETIVGNDDWRVVINVIQEDIGMLTQIEAEFYEK